MLFQKNLLAALLFTILSLAAAHPAQAQAFAVSITVDQAIGCQGDQNGQLTASVPGGGNSFTFHWSNGATGATIQGLGAGAYSVTATGAAGGPVGTATASLAEPPGLLASVQVSDIITCYNPSVQVSAAATGGTPPYQYAWSTGDNLPSFETTVPGVLTLVLSDAHGCQRVETADVQANTTVPDLMGDSQETITCLDGTTTLEVTCTNSTAVGYQWSTPDGHIVSGATTAQPVVDAPGTYAVVVTNFPNGCTAARTVVVGSEYLTLSTNSLSPVMANPTATIDVLTVGGVSPYVFMWKDEANLPVSSEEDLTTETSGLYTLTVADANGCVATLGPIQVEAVTATSDLTGAGIRVFPNPVSTLLTLELPNTNGFSWRAVNAIGQEVAAGVASDSNLSINVSEWSKGWYIFTFLQPRGPVGIRVQVQ